MRDVIFDIETDGLLDDLTVCHSLVLRDVETNEVLSCTDASPEYPSIEEGLRVLRQAGRIYGHNILRFDLPALRVLYPDFDIPRERVFDTLVMTRMRFAHIKQSDFKLAARRKLPAKLIGNQGIEAWGHRLGNPKGEYKLWCKEHGIEYPFDVWRPEMQDYCEQDTDTNRDILLHLRKMGIPAEALEAEMELAWYLAQQELNGWPFDEEKALSFHARLQQKLHDLEQELIEHFGTWCEPGKEFTPKADNSRYGYVKYCTFTRLKWYEFNPGSRNHIANRLKAVYGWEPEAFTPGGDPQVDESALKSVIDEIPVAPALLEYLDVKKMLGQLADGNKSWLNYTTESGRWGGRITGVPHIHHSIGNVAVTHRHRHSHPNLGQVRSADTKYGPESRELFTVPPGWKLVGSDASGLELRCLAHYLAKWDDGEYGQIILNGDKAQGTDIHSVNAKALGLTRPEAKTWIYAWLYGAGNTKLGSISDPTADEATQARIGARLKRRFMKKLPAMGYLSKAVQKAAKEKKYLRLPDGRRAYIRSTHAALNTLLQGSGAIICKHWGVEFSRRLMEEFDTPPGGGWEHPWAAVGWIHDEYQIAAREDVAERVAEIVRTSIVPVGEKFGWRIPLEAEAQVGDSWKDTH